MARRELPGILHTAGMEARLAPEVETCLKQRFKPEVVIRQRKPKETKAEKEKASDDVDIDLKVASSLKPARRLAWLAAACKMGQDGRASGQDIFNIITARRFTMGVSKRLGKTMVDTVNEATDIFSEKQQRLLRSDEWVLNTFVGLDDDVVGEAANASDADSDAAAPDRPPPPRESQGSRRDSERPVRSFRERESEESRPLPREEVPRLHEEKKPGGWVSVSFEKGSRRAGAIVREMDERGEQRQQLETKVKKQLEVAADSSLDMLERLTQQREPPRASPRHVEAPRDVRDGYGHSKGLQLRSRSRSRRTGDRGDRRGRKGCSRSRSVSVQAKRDPSVEGRRRVKKGMSFDDALRQRMEERDRYDTTRSSIVQENYQGKKLRQFQLPVFRNR